MCWKHYLQPEVHRPQEGHHTRYWYNVHKCIEVVSLTPHERVNAITPVRRGTLQIRQQIPAVRWQMNTRIYLPWMILICFKKVLLPLSPDPKRRTLTVLLYWSFSFWSCSSILLLLARWLLSSSDIQHLNTSSAILPVAVSNIRMREALKYRNSLL